MRRFPAVIAIQLSLLAPPAAALDLGQQPFTVRTVREDAAVHAVVQAPDGLIWFGSRMGLTRFDGDRFVDVPLGSGTPEPAMDSWVRRMQASADGSIWVAVGAGSLELTARPGSPPRVFTSHGAGAELLQLWPQRPPGSADRLRRFSVADGLPDPWVWALAEDMEGGMWVGTEKGLVRFAGGRAQRFSTAHGLPASFITALADTGDGKLYVGTSAGLAIYHQGRFRRLAIREPVIAMTRDRAGRVWVAGHSRLWRLDRRGGLDREFQVQDAAALAVDQHDNLWLAGCLPEDCRQGATVTVFVAGEPRSLSTPLTPFRSATDLLIDREGSVWFGLREGGVTQLSSPPVRNLGLEEGLSGRIAFSVRHASDSSTYVATTGGISRYLGGKWTTWPDGDDTIGSGPRDIAEGPPGTPAAGMWFASEGHLLRGDARGFRRTLLKRPPFLAGTGGSRSIMISRTGDVFLSRAEPLALLRLPAGDVRRARVELQQGDGLCPGKLAHGLEAADGSLWFVGDYGAHGAGATRVKDGRARCLGPADGLPDAQIGAVVEDQEGTIWLGTGWGAGLVRYRDGRFRPLPASIGLPPSSIVGLLDDGRGFLWICSESGVWRLPKVDLHRCADHGCSATRADVYGKQQGMRVPECMGVFHPNLTLDGQGNVWAATLGGVSVFAPPERAQRAVLKPVVEEIAIDGLPVPIASTARLGPGRSLVVRYTIPTFIGASRPRLQHRLAGFDADWVMAPAGVAHYHDLAAGSYTLELGAQQGGGETTLLTIVATPPFWRTPAFLTAIVLGLSGLGLALHLSRVGRLGLRHRAMNEERVRIARELHDGLAQKLRAIGLLSDRLRPEGGPGAEKLKKMRQIIGEAHAELRRAIWDMREGTESVRVEVLIEQLLSQLVIPTGTEVNLQTSGSSLPVPSLVAHEVRLVAKEALANALAHALARNIEIGVLSDEEGLHVWVRDDGRGGLLSEQEAAGRGHYGLLGMFERARRLGGVLTTRSEPGVGTEVSLFVTRAQMQGGVR